MMKTNRMKLLQHCTRDKKRTRRRTSATVLAAVHCIAAALHLKQYIYPDRPIVWNKSFKPVVQTIVLNFFLIEYRSIFLLGLYFFLCVLSSHPPPGLFFFIYFFN